MVVDRGVPMKVRDDVRSPGAEVIGVCKLIVCSAGN